MKVLITGGTGFVGSHVARQLLSQENASQGYSVRLLVRDVDKAERLYRQLGIGQAEFIKGDVTDLASVKEALLGCDAVVHAAAATPIAGVDNDQLLAVNVGGVNHVIGTAVELGLKSMVHVSSITAIFNTDASKVNAESELAVSSMPYGQSKVQAERYVRQLQQQGAPVSIVYPGGIIGPHDPGFSDAFKALHHRINNGFRIIDDGGIQHIDVRDLSAFIISLLNDGGNGRYPLPGPYCKWSDLADIIDDVSGCNLQRIAAKGWKLRLLGTIVDGLRWFKKIDTPISAETMRYATLWPNITNTLALEERGLILRSTRETFADSLEWMLDAEHLSAEQVPKLINKKG